MIKAWLGGSEGSKRVQEGSIHLNTVPSAKTEVFYDFVAFTNLTKHCCNLMFVFDRMMQEHPCTCRVISLIPLTPQFGLYISPSRQ